MTTVQNGTMSGGGADTADTLPPLLSSLQGSGSDVILAFNEAILAGSGSLTLTGEYAKVQFNNVSFANLVAWLDAQRRENRIQVQDAAFTGLPAAGQVDATLTLRQNLGQSVGAPQ